MTQEERVIKAKVNLLLNQPWFGQLACYLNLIEKEENEIPTAAINERGDLFFNPKFIEQLKDSELRGLVCHEILHLAFQHPFRIQARNPVLWNIAADLKVNDEIRDNQNISLPAGGLIPGYDSKWKFAGIQIKGIDTKTTEQIYEELYSKVPKFEISISYRSGSPSKGKGQKGKDQQGSGSNKGGTLKIDTSKLPKPWKDLVEKMVKDLLKAQDKKEVKPSDLSQLSKDWQERIDTANQTSKGSVPAGLARELKALENPELPWYQIIRQRFTKLVRKKTWRKPSKKWLPIYFPGSEKNKSIKAVLAIDTSGSMTTKDISKAVSEIWGIANTFKEFNLFIVFNDAKVWDIVEVSNGNKHKIKNLRPKGGGGTDFRPVFNLIKEKWQDRIDCLVFFTDGYGDFPNRKPLYQVYWITQSSDIKWPFGQEVRLKHS